MERNTIKQALETIFFVANRPLSTKQLTKIIGECDSSTIRELVSELNQSYKKTNRVFRIESISDGFQMHTLPEFRKWALALETVKTIKLSPAVMETLAIISYHQPVTRAEIEKIRGKPVFRGTLDTLLELEWIKPSGRRETPGRPVTWVTDLEFLRHFGLSSIKDLPKVDELESIIL